MYRSVIDTLLSNTNNFSTLAGVSLITRHISAFMKPSSVVSFTELVQSISHGFMKAKTCMVIKETPASVEKLLVLCSKGTYTTWCERSKMF
jgi:hypothetical protein